VRSTTCSEWNTVPQSARRTFDAVPACYVLHPSIPSPFKLKIYCVKAQATSSTSTYQHFRCMVLSADSALRPADAAPFNNLGCVTHRSYRHRPQTPRTPMINDARALPPRCKTQSSTVAAPVSEGRMCVTLRSQAQYDKNSLKMPLPSRFSAGLTSPNHSRQWSLVHCLPHAPIFKAGHFLMHLGGLYGDVAVHVNTSVRGRRVQ
jgi:hypothetical protein